MKALRTILAVASLIGTVGAASAMAAVVTTEATDNATVQPGGPRTGANGKAFFNIEGNTTGGTFASYGVAEFTLSTAGFGGPVAAGDILSVQLELTQANAAFTTDGLLNIYITQDNATSIQPGPPLFFDATALPDGLDGQLSTGLSQVASGVSFTEVANGQLDVYTLSLSGADLAYLAGQINSGSAFRVIVTPDDLTVAATYAGFSNTSATGPQLVITTIPEPSTVALVGTGLFGLLALRCRKR